MLSIMSFFFLFAWLPSSLGKYKSFGSKWLASNRNPLPGKELNLWGARAERAYQNLKDFYPPFVVAIFLLGILGKFDQTTAWCSGIYVISRIAHMASYIAGIVSLRALFWTISVICNVILLIKIF